MTGPASHPLHPDHTPTGQLAFGVFGPNPISDLLKGLIAYLPNVLVAIVIIVVAAAIAGAAYDLISSALGGLTYGRLLARTASILIIVGVGLETVKQIDAQLQQRHYEGLIR
mgnify:CR=1 FL=1